jgi:uncharacterized UBP type Zn finger protein
MHKLIMRSPQNDLSNESMLPNYHMILCSFKNPPKRNLCFSNAVVSLLLNIPVFKDLLKKEENKNINEETDIFKELYKLANLPKFSKASTQRLRYLTKRKCVETGDITKNFSDNNQHDAGEFISSILPYIFENSDKYAHYDEILFGGLWQSILTCTCGDINEGAVEKMPEILPIEVYGKTIQQCTDHYFLPEKVERTCKNCHSTIA